MDPGAPSGASKGRPAATRSSAHPGPANAGQKMVTTVDKVRFRNAEIVDLAFFNLFHCQLSPVNFPSCHPELVEGFTYQAKRMPGY
jgi:hypothetical protein